MNVSPILNKANIESRAFIAARRIFGRYGVNVADPNITAGSLRGAMRRMNAREYETVITAFGAVMGVNGRIRPPVPLELSEEDKYKKLQDRAYHFKNHPEDLPKPLPKVN